MQHARIIDQNGGSSVKLPKCERAVVGKSKNEEQCNWSLGMLSMLIICCA